MTLSVWITICVFSFFSFLLAYPLPKMESLIMEFDYNKLNATVKCDDSSIFYTPTNVKPGCIATAKKCFFMEFSEVVRVECEPKNIIGSNLEVLEMIQIHVKEKYVEDSANDCVCEKWPQTPFYEFLTRYKAFLQLLNSNGIEV